MLQENDVEFQKTHDLDYLLEKSKPFLPALSSIKSDIVELSTFAVEVRYPGADATREEAEKALAVTSKCRKMIRAYFKLPDE